MTKVTKNLIPKGNKNGKSISIPEKITSAPTANAELEQKIDKFLKTFKTSRP